MENSTDTRLPQLTLFVPGPWCDEHEMAVALRGQSIGDEMACVGEGRITTRWVPNDGGFGLAFEFSPVGSIASEVRSEIDKAAGGVVVEAAMRLDRDAPRVASLAHALRRAGGFAVRVEESGAAFEWEAWIARLDAGLPGALYSCAVVLVSDEHHLYSCGMHLFDRPDAETPILDDPNGAAALLHAFNVYQLEKDPILVSGHTFAPDARAPRRWLERWPDGRHHSRSPHWNPFGLWVLETSRPQHNAPTELALTITPSLVSVLLAREKQAQAPLRRDEVESIVAASPCIALPREVARQLERSRGYADIDPEFAWEHWQRLRDKL